MQNMQPWRWATDKRIIIIGIFVKICGKQANYFYLSRGSEYFFHRGYKSAPETVCFTHLFLFSSSGAYLKLLFLLQRLPDWVKLKYKVNKDVGDRLLEVTLRRPPCVWLPQSLTCSHGGEVKLQPDSCTLPAHWGWLHNYPKASSTGEECVCVCAL